MYPTNRQQKIIQRWFASYILTYNEALKYIKQTTKFSDLKKIKEIDKMNISYVSTLKNYKNEQNKLKNKHEKLVININNSNQNKKTKTTKKLYDKRIKEIIELRQGIKNLNKKINELNLKIKKYTNIRSKLYDDIYKNINYYNVRSYKIKDIRDKIIQTSKLKTRFNKKDYDTCVKAHMLDCAIKLACASYKSCFTNYLNGHTDKFRVKYWKLNRTNKILEIEPSFIKDNQICQNVLGKIKYQYNNEPYVLNKQTVSIHYEGLTGKYTLLVYEKIKCEETNKKGYIGIDPGVRKFMTGLSKNQIIKMGTNLNEIIKSYLLRIDKINNNDNINKEKKENLSRKYNRKIKNKVEETHWKIIKCLTDNYSTIIIGDLSMKDVSKKGVSKISQMTKRIGYRMCHYKFRQRLAYKCATKGINLKIVDESYTSKTCSVCGNYKKELESETIYNCEKCKRIIDRDINGSRCIMMKVIK